MHICSWLSNVVVVVIVLWNLVANVHAVRLKVVLVMVVVMADRIVIVIVEQGRLVVVMLWQPSTMTVVMWQPSWNLVLSVTWQLVSSWHW